MNYLIKIEGLSYATNCADIRTASSETEHKKNEIRKTRIGVILVIAS